MSKNNNSKLKKILSKYNYWRKSLDMFFVPKRKSKNGSNCQVACHSDPCSADPTCSSDD